MMIDRADFGSVLLVRELTERSVLEVHGADARSWLNGQVTNDVRNTQPGQAVYALALSPKGRIVADVWVVDRRTSEADADSFALVVPAGVETALRAHLEHYIIMEDCVVEPQHELAIISAQGPDAATLAASPEVAALRPYATDWLGGVGLDVLVPRSASAAWCAKLAVPTPTDTDVTIDDASLPARWETRRISAGTPLFGADFGPEQLPQEAGLRKRAVSFSKGCYLGQEVVVMLEHRGQVPRALCRFELDAQLEAPEVGAALVDGAGAHVGALTSVAPLVTPGARRAALGYVRRQLLEQPTALFCAGAALTLIGRVGDASSEH